MSTVGTLLSKEDVATLEGLFGTVVRRFARAIGRAGQHCTPKTRCSIRRTELRCAVAQLSTRGVTPFHRWRRSTSRTFRFLAKATWLMVRADTPSR